MITESERITFLYSIQGRSQKFFEGRWNFLYGTKYFGGFLKFFSKSLAIWRNFPKEGGLKSPHPPLPRLRPWYYRFSSYYRKLTKILKNVLCARLEKINEINHLKSLQFFKFFFESYWKFFHPLIYAILQMKLR